MDTSWNRATGSCVKESPTITTIMSCFFFSIGITQTGENELFKSPQTVKYKRPRKRASSGNPTDPPLQTHESATQKRGTTRKLKRAQNPRKAQGVQGPVALRDKKKVLFEKTHFLSHSFPPQKKERTREKHNMLATQLVFPNNIKSGNSGRE